MAKEITCTFTRRLAVLSEKKSGYTKQANYVSWNGADAKLDIRDWSPDGKSMKGLTLTEEEAKALYETLRELYDESGHGVC